ncbi:MAG TPA: acyl-CoA desaturase, partial [Pseudonocardiaceae bacterium]|nr:acyl-CoA desaturase [Pseudonocardiaceae bacterium]
MTAAATHRPAAAPLVEGRKTATEQALVVAFMVVPLLALAAAVPLAWGWGLSWL